MYQSDCKLILDKTLLSSSTLYPARQEKAMQGILIVSTNLSNLCSIHFIQSFHNSHNASSYRIRVQPEILFSGTWSLVWSLD